MAAPKPKEIREAFEEYRNEWKEIYDEGDLDMRYIAGDPWDPGDRDQRKQNGRPCLSCDELNQYLNQYCNNLRQAKRAIEISPKGDGANDADAKMRRDIIRGIEDDSNAQGCYITAAEGAAQRGYGFGLIRTEYQNNDEDFNETTFDQTIKIQRVANPNSILINPNYKQADASDIVDGFVIDRIRKKLFKDKYPNAETKDFTDQVMADAGEGINEWITEKTVQIAEYWKIEHSYKNALLVDPGDGNLIVLKEEDFDQLVALRRGQHRRRPEVKRERRIEIPKAMQYPTNGLEILDEIEWVGTRIPIISCFGKEIWMREGGRDKRKLFSMVRLARDPQMLFAYLCTQECEEAGQIPKTPFVGYKGQFESDREVWEELNQVPHAFVQADVVVDGATGQILPLPQRPQYVANFQEWEVAKDSARRSIMSAMGITPLPTAAQRNNEKSGIALDKITEQQDVGSFHLTDNFKRFLHNVGWQVNELLSPILDTTRTQPIRKPDGKASTLQVVGNTSHPIDDAGTYDVQGLDQEHYHTGKGTFGVTVSDGPSYQSEREAQSDFVDHLIANWQTLGIPVGVSNKVLAKAIRMKDLGPVGEDIANLLDPPDPSNLPPQAQAVIAQLQGKLQSALVELQGLHMDRAGRVLEQQTKITLQEMKSQSDERMQQLANDIKVLLAEIGTKSQDQAQRQEMFMQFWKENHGAAHEVGLQKDQQAHEAEQAQQAHLRATELASQAAAAPDQGQAQPTAAGPAAQ